MKTRQTFQCIVINIKRENLEFNFTHVATRTSLIDSKSIAKCRLSRVKVKKRVLVMTHLLDRLRTIRSKPPTHGKRLAKLISASFKKTSVLVLKSNRELL